MVFSLRLFKIFLSKLESIYIQWEYIISISNHLYLRKKMKKTLIIFGLLSILTTTISASGFATISYGKGLEDKTVIEEEGNELTFANLQSIRLRLGTQYFPIEDEQEVFGGYLDLALGHNDKTYEGAYPFFNILVNTGTTYTLNNYIVLFTGIGISHDRVKYKETNEVENKLNVNVGTMIYLYESKFGLTLEYDTAPKLVNVGLSFRF